MLTLGRMRQNGGARGSGGWLVAECLGKAETAFLCLVVEKQAARVARIIWLPGTHKRYSDQALRKHASMFRTEVWRTLHFLLTLISRGRGSKHLFTHLRNQKLLMSPRLGKLILQCDSKGTSLHLMICDHISGPLEGGEGCHFKGLRKLAA